VDIRRFQRGDESAQVSIYNEAAARLPKFKPATVPEVQRRVNAGGFDPAMRLFAVESGEPVAYVAWNPDGRIGFPWCRKGREQAALDLFQHALQTLKSHGLARAYTAYRADWPAVLAFFRKQEFTPAREVINFVLELWDMPTAQVQRSRAITPLAADDVPALFAMAPRLVRCKTAAELEHYLLDNPYFPPSSVFVIRDRQNQAPLAAGILIQDVSYADPMMVDSAMPCFRLGAFGTEGMNAKRIKGLFSFLCPDDPHAAVLGTELMFYAAELLQESDEIVALAAQVPSDAIHLLRFYHLKFRRQGAFPVLERAL
jgi:hypothetical protein